MLLNVVLSVGKPTRLAHAALATVLLLIVTLPTSSTTSANSQLSQAQHDAFVSDQVNSGALLGDDATQPQPPEPQPQKPEAACPPDGQCFADVPSSNPFFAFVNRLYQHDVITGYTCGGLGEPCDAYSRPYYRPLNNVNRQQMAKFTDEARHRPGIYIDTSTHAAPLYARTTMGNGVGVWGSSTHDTGVGVRGSAEQGIGVLGVTNSVFNNDGGVHGTSTGGTGVRGESTSGNGVFGTSSSESGVYGYSLSGNGIYGSACSSCGGRAGYFGGSVQVTGNLSKGGGSFKIDHPLDPENKYLYHSFVESPDMMNVYNGNITLDSNGEAVVRLPEWFEALNKDFRYQLTPIGGFAPLYIADKVKENRFKIAGGSPGLEVSWQVTGIRQDPYANAHRIPVQEEKPADERGKYLHPTEWGKPASTGIDYDESLKGQEVSERKP